MKIGSTKARWLVLLALMMALALVMSACSSDDGGDDDEATEDAEAGDEPTEEEADEPTEEEADEPTEEEADEPTEDEATEDGGEAEGDDDGTLQVAIMGECEGAFGGFAEDVVAGASLAFINLAGATSVSSTSALEGFEGAEVAGVPIELVGIGCGDDTPDRAIEEIRTLVEENGAEVVFGPLSGDESIAIANYALDHPEVTFIDGIAGAQETTLAVQAPNYFRWHGEGAMWNAGLGEVLHNEAGWDTAAIIVDDYSFGWTSAAGFIADFCGVGGEVTTRVFPPLGTTDYSSFVQQLPGPDEVDGYFWVVGGTGTQAALEAFINIHGELSGAQHAGNLFFNPGLASAIGPSIAGAYIGGFAAFPGDVQTPEIEEYLASADAAWETLPSGLSGGEPGAPSVAAGFGFMYGYYSGAYAFLTALANVEGDLSNNHEAVRAEMQGLEVNPGYFPMTLDENNQAVIDTFVAQLVEDEETGEIVQVTDRIIKGVTQDFGGTFSADTPPPGQDFPECVEADLPWVGNSIPVVDGVPQE